MEGLLEALSAAYGAGARISVEDLEPYLGEAGSVPRYELTDAISRGEPSAAPGVLHRMLDAGGLSAGRDPGHHEPPLRPVAGPRWRRRLG